MKTILVNIDGTLADVEHRLHFIDGSKHGSKDWLGFFDAMGADSPIEPICDLVRSIADGLSFEIVFVTGRPDSHGDATAEWLESVARLPRRPLYMRKSGDRRPDHVVKRELLRAIRDDGFEPTMAIEDRVQVVDMWRGQGLICLQCGPGKF